MYPGQLDWYLVVGNCRLSFSHVYPEIDPTVIIFMSMALLFFSFLRWLARSLHDNAFL